MQEIQAIERRWNEYLWKSAMEEREADAAMDGRNG
jgi:hypothetical protein